MRNLFVTLSVGLFLLGGCASLDTGGKSIFQGGSSLTASVNNPVGKKELAVAERTYQASARAFIACRETRCQSVDRLRAIQKLDREKVYPSLVAARRFVRDNPRISGSSAVGAAISAVREYQAAVGR